MFSFLGDLFGLLLTCLWRIAQRTVEELNGAVDGFVWFLYTWLLESHDSPQQTRASLWSSVGPPKDLTTWPWSLFWPTPLVRVRVPARRSIR